MYAFSRILSMTIGVAVGGTVFQNLMSQKLSELSLLTQIANDAEAYVAVIRTMAASDPTRVAVIQAYVHGFRVVFAAMTVMAGMGLLASLAIKRHNMSKVLESQYRLSRNY